MTVEGEGAAQSQASHGLEAHPVDEAHRSASGAQQGVEGAFVDLLTDPDDLRDREELVAQARDRLQSKARLNERDGLDHDEAVGDESLLAVEQPGERLERAVVLWIVGVQYRVQRGGVD